ncbi:hypothetical protein FNJ87_12010 [Nonlabens mediterrranea]|uniref:DUF4136 domain-containing protein n=1 Tax=Nonlabens mediterrranea TaxID=1419947 RepID=A0ABS0A883_9FLAO|nr:hypothetical protein BBFL7_02244 [Flavobacteria bacterium BBFL7]MBF4985028.1 hypothetical protein [Nonlabens mediterrranea]
MKIFLLFLSLFLLCSCKKEVKTAITEEPTFDYKAYLLKNDENVLSVEISNFDSEPIIKELKKILNTSCFDGIKFNAVTKYGIINSSVSQFCENTAVCARGFGVTVIINRDNQILLDEELVHIDNFQYLEIENYFNRFDKKNCYLTIYNDKYANQEIVDTVVQSFISSYIRYTEKLSKKNFYQPLRNLNSRELDSLKNISSFYFHFKEENIYSPAPTVPAASEINNEF